MERTETSPKRKTIFISHATPGDNEITQWLGLRLMREGYSVWFDIDKLRVGNDFWKVIENQIRNEAAKFIIILSKVSVDREGVLNELAVAKKVAKQIGGFIIPVRADDLSYDDIPIEINRLDVADFSKSWSFGINRILETLEEDAVPRGGDKASDAADWWRTRYAADEGVFRDREEYSSNFVKLTQRPKNIYLHRLDDLKPFEEQLFKPAFPVFKIHGLFASFAPAKDLKESFNEADAAIGGTFTSDLNEFLRWGYTKPTIKKREARNAVIHLLRMSFHRQMKNRGLREYELSGKAKYYWFPEALVGARKQIRFTRPNGTAGSRALVGSKKLKSMTGEIIGLQGWHYGLEVVPTVEPRFGFYLRPHVVFTLNGVSYPDTGKQHTLRRRECKTWYNDRWGDMMLAAVKHIADGDSFVLQFGSDLNSELSLVPEVYVSPVRYVWEKESKVTDTDEGDDRDEIMELEEDEQEEEFEEHSYGE